MITLERVLTENNKLSKLETKLMMSSKGLNLKLLRELMDHQGEENTQVSQEQDLANNLDLLSDRINQDKLTSHKQKRDNEVEMK